MTDVFMRAQVLDVLYGHGAQVEVTPAFFSLRNIMGAAMMPPGILAPTLATVNVSTLPSERYAGCAHPLASITTLAACTAAARDVAGAVNDELAQVNSSLTADQWVIASMQKDGCHFQLTPPSCQLDRHASSVTGLLERPTVELALSSEAAYLAQVVCTAHARAPAQ